MAQQDQQAPEAATEPDLFAVFDNDAGAIATVDDEAADPGPGPVDATRTPEADLWQPLPETVEHTVPHGSLRASA